MASIASCNSRRGHFPFGLMLKIRFSSDISTFYWLHDRSRQSENFQFWQIGRFPHRATDWDIQRATNDDGWTRAFTPFALATADLQASVISALSPIAY